MNKTVTQYARRNGKTFAQELGRRVHELYGVKNSVFPPLSTGKVTKEQLMEMFLKGGHVEEFKVLGLMVKAMHYEGTLYIMEME